MKEQVQLLIVQYKEQKEDAEYEANMLSSFRQDLTLSKNNIKLLNDIDKEIEMLTIFILELQGLTS